MQKKPYRNALRSQRMIRTAFIELLAEKPMERITVVDIVQRSDLSRNTFYAHYQDVYAVLEEFQAEALAQLKAGLEEAAAEHAVNDPLPLLQQIADYVDENKQTYKVLLNGTSPDKFITEIKQLLLTFVFANITETDIRDLQGFRTFMEVLAAGFIQLFQQYLRGETQITSREIANEVNRIYLAGLPLYK